MFHRKAGIDLTAAQIVSILLLIAGFIFLIQSFSFAVERSEDPISEKLCESFNAARARSSIRNPIKDISFIPNACKVIDKELPEKGYAETTKGVQANLRRRIPKCWDMWLKGSYP